jgi:divalent metal cation (Fe/Co/Zn/Cd) transporter
LHLKFPDDLDLRSAHEVAERVERAIRGRPGVDDVQTHLEPLERPQRAKAGDSQADEATLHEVQALVRERTGREAASARLLSTDAGRVLFLTLSGRDGESLADAHLLTGELEDQLRLRIGDLADVVIHTEP